MNHTWVNASAGSGKTYLVIQKIVELLELGVKPERILCLTFTNTGAKEMQERILKHKSPAVSKMLDGPLVKVQTIHGFCKEFLERFLPIIRQTEEYRILSQEESHTLITETLRAMPFFEESYAFLLRFFSKSRIENLVCHFIHKTIDTSFFEQHPYVAIDDNQMFDVFTKTFGLRAKPKIKDPELIDYIRDGVYRNVENDLYEINKHFNHVLETLKVHYATEKERQSLKDYHDLLVVTHDILSKKAFEKEIASIISIDYLFVDEAQDTSPLQWNIIKEIIKRNFNEPLSPSLPDSLKGVWVVGDPKQSIYSFQGADTKNFEEVQKKLPLILGQEFEILDKSLSFRSTADVLKHVDLTLSHFGTTHVAHRMDKGSVSLALYPKDTLIQNSADLIEDIYKRGHKNILVLFKHRTPYMDKVNETLHKKGLNVSGIDRCILQNHLFAKDILSFFKFLNLPEDDYNLACLLRSPFFGMSFDDIHAIVKKGKPLYKNIPSELYEKLLSTSQIAGFLTVSELFFYLLHNYPYGDDVPPAIHDAFLEKIIAFEEKNPACLLGFIHHMEHAVDAVSLQKDADIKLMTIHGSKGLEADIVVVIDDGKPPSLQKEDFLDTVQEKSILKPSQMMTIPKVEDLKELALQKLLQEHERLLYVAMTRARDHLYVIAPDDYKEKSFASLWNEKIPTTITLPEKKTEQECLNPVKATPWSPPIIISAEPKPFVYESYTNELIETGKKVHKLLEQFPLTRTQWEESVSIPYPNALFNDALFLSFFKAHYLFEVEISLDHERVRLDLLCIDAPQESFTIVEFKTFKKHTSHITQVKKYKNALQTLYPGNTVNAYLVCVLSQTIEEVI